jgi:hypothetical protein
MPFSHTNRAPINFLQYSVMLRFMWKFNPINSYNCSKAAKHYSALLLLNRSQHWHAYNVTSKFTLGKYRHMFGLSSPKLVTSYSFLLQTWIITNIIPYSGEYYKSWSNMTQPYRKLKSEFRISIHIYYSAPIVTPKSYAYLCNTTLTCILISL